MNILIYSELTSLTLTLTGVGMFFGFLLSIKVKTYKCPGIEIMYKTDIDSVKVMSIPSMEKR